MRLLVVEDDPDLNRQLTTALTDAGYVVDRAFDGEEGHFLGESEPYDAVILDIGLPKMDGISVLESWRRAGRGRRRNGGREWLYQSKNCRQNARAWSMFWKRSGNSGRYISI